MYFSSRFNRGFYDNRNDDTIFVYDILFYGRKVEEYQVRVGKFETLMDNRKYADKQVAKYVAAMSHAIEIVKDKNLARCITPLK